MKQLWQVLRANQLTQSIKEQESFEKYWAHSPQRAVSRQFTRCRHCTVARRLRIDVHKDDNDDDDDNAWQREPLWPHGMGPTITDYRPYIYPGGNVPTRFCSSQLKLPDTISTRRSSWVTSGGVNMQTLVVIACNFHYHRPSSIQLYSTFNMEWNPPFKFEIVLTLTLKRFLRHIF